MYLLIVQDPLKELWKCWSATRSFQSEVIFMKWHVNEHHLQLLSVNHSSCQVGMSEFELDLLILIQTKLVMMLYKIFNLVRLDIFRLLPKLFLFINSSIYLLSALHVIFSYCFVPINFLFFPIPAHFFFPPSLLNFSSFSLFLCNVTS